ncbi:Uncharacterised protein [Yersinia enterocolitica]|uniref:Uncharacterized protein n=1 Tax=Yersinia enterocolitica TaxID=630 RepID=A0A0H5GSL3_YEREN|nr:Uncharacterised protein [Yersinia enterocolitica]CFV22507.1 Uncharacterised protein [Yersinia enterocolitica]CFW62107.1 Uncharacterised protein [Yersinia enterocolitica]CNB53977.1 Uncharacterised protein [Yersinia enterocolitica]CNB72357.1 Uncharacterised protein [Yersinia enterocolitica]
MLSRGESLPDVSCYFGSTRGYYLYFIQINNPIYFNTIFSLLSK